MSIFGVWVRFGAAYVVMGTAAMVLLRLLELDAAPSLFAAVAMGAALRSTVSFEEITGRCFLHHERMPVTLGMLVVDLLLQASISAARLAGPSHATSGGTADSFLMVLLHGTAIFAALLFAERLAARRHAAEADAQDADA